MHYKWCRKYDHEIGLSLCQHAVNYNLLSLSLHVFINHLLNIWMIKADARGIRMIVTKRCMRVVITVWCWSMAQRFSKHVIGRGVFLVWILMTSSLIYRVTRTPLKTRDGIDHCLGTPVYSRNVFRGRWRT
jgi:hypothetical protein